MARQRDALPRLNIPASLNMQQPMQAMFSPALPTSIQQGFNPPLPMQTPMQPFFNPHMGPPSARPGHHGAHASIAHLAAAGIHPPNGFPMTPMGGHFARPSMQMNGPPGGHPFPGRNRRQLSIGGPPKAVLGGPNRKLSPIPPTAASPSPAPPPVKQKKVVINLPKETIRAEDGSVTGRAEWARRPLDGPPIPPAPVVAPVETNTREDFPSDIWRYTMPSTVDVFLPGKSAWDAIKQMAIEEKLEKLGVERGGGSVPPIFAPHARAASISSPADPALLLFKLNKLQQSQHTSATIPSHRPLNLYLACHPPPIPRRAANSILYGFNNTSGTSLNPFGHDAVLGSDQIPARSPRVSPGPAQAEIHAPQGRVPVAYSSLAPPSISSSVRSDSRPDFTRGFGLEIPEEEEEEEEDAELPAMGEADDTDVEEPEDDESSHHGSGTASPSRHHSRHTSRLSAALSLRSFGVFNTDGLNERTDVKPGDLHVEPEKQDLDGVEEWTGSEDVFMGHESSDNESIGEYSNPSDEERARRQRVERRMRRRALQQEDEQPRRIPKFPRPPNNTIIMHPRRDDDIISNPSDEGHRDYLGVHDFYDRPASNGSGSSSRPLPPLPSSQYPIHDPAEAHSPNYSDVNFGSAEPPIFPVPRLNPNAKPFVFGAPRGASGSFQPATPTSVENPSSHSRVPSIGKPLNVTAPEFKPGNFTFKFPTANPILPVPEPYRPLPVPPADESSPFRVQGREKRRRQGSHDSVDEGESFASFKFPPTPQRRAISPRPPLRSGHSSLNPSAEPFTFAGFSAAAHLPPIRPAAVDSDEDGSQIGVDDTAAAEYGDSAFDMFTLPTATKTKRAPIPLDFKHTVSSNTVPAGLFKALVNNPEERTRKNVRSRMSSREVFEHMSRPSLDDLNVPAISHKVSRTRLVTDPGKQVTPSDDLFSSMQHVRRRSSLPDALHSPSGSSMSEESSILPAKDLTGRLELHRLEDLLDEKLAALRRDIRGGSTMNPKTESMINEVVSLFRSQLRDSAARSLEDSQLDARGELDFQLIRNVIEEGHAETMAHLRKELASMAQSLANGRPIVQGNGDIEQYSAHTVSAINEAIYEMGGRLESIGRAAPARERDAIVDSIVSALSPMLSSLRPEVVDYDFLTDKLTQAVKPHISQLIDLASDKRETAGMIVDSLVPMLPHLQEHPVVDTDAISIQLVSAVTRAIAPIDAFEIKEQVSDLVVERLDARLANRDKGFNVESIADRVTESVSRLLNPLSEVRTSLATLTDGQRSMTSKQADLSSGHAHIARALNEIPSKVLSAIDHLGRSQAELISSVAKAQGVEVKEMVPDENVLHIKSVVDDLGAKQRATLEHTAVLMEVHKDVLQKVSVLPETFSMATHVLQEAHAEFTLSRDTIKRELDDLRKSNTEYQVQVAKARGAHGQVRVEKEVLSEKLNIVEADRDRLRAQLKEVQDNANAKAEESSIIAGRNSELQEALAKALARLQASDVATQANTARIAELEKANQDLLFDKRSLKTKIDNLEVKAAYSSRDKEVAEDTISSLRKQNEELTSQSGQWDNLRQASEQLQLITTLMQQADEDEVKDLKRARDRAKILEGEHAALQKRFKEQEARVSNSDKSAFTARQSLSQAQQRASEWEKRAKEYEGKLEMTRTQLEQAEQTQVQLDADYQMVRMQLDEREANDRLAQDRESKLQEQVTALEAKIRVMQTEFQKARTSTTTPVRAPVARNGYARPDSRASTAYDRSRSVTPNGQIKTSVYDSIHAPKTNGIRASMHAPAAPSRYPSHLSRAAPASRQQAFSRSQAPSPTPSTVSLAPTVDADGWWQ
ncbi:hypothetical protein CPB85DRAFT_1444158 [Mucidula mucida]|nr:hypothetical protein CPB85DRAFT_1444158 [Mucidula mucida]